MKLLITAVLLATTAAAAPAFAQSIFDGTWKGELSTIKMPAKTDVYLLKNGMYDCRTCVPRIAIKADGEYHKVSGSPYFDTMAVKVVNDHTITETDKKDGKVVGTSTTTVAPDGKTATFEFTDSSDTDGAPVTGSGSMERVAAGPKGSDAISGTWRDTSFSNLSENGLTVTFKTEGKDLTMTNPTGQSYTAVLSGGRAPYHGDPGISTVSVYRTGTSTLEEKDMLHGRLVGFYRMTVLPGGKSMKVFYNDYREKKMYSWMSEKV